tara:strand:- start:498 stop:2066 length:1569 start_codon:yes stop_codon:yes gene_type:complete
MNNDVKYPIKLSFFLACCFLFFVLSSCAEKRGGVFPNYSSSKDLSIDLKYQVYCGSCHLTPNPKNITKTIWEKNVLPDMASRLGYKFNNYNPHHKNSMEENLLIRMRDVYPENSVIDSLTWRQIYDYIIDMAPDSIPIDRLRTLRNSPLTQFKSKEINLGEINNAGIVNIEFEVLSNQFYIGDASGEVHKWPRSFNSVLRFNSPVISCNKIGNEQLFTEIGIMKPSEKSQGIIQRSQLQKWDTLAKNLHRPVFTEIVDLNDDGTNEILICEFGNYSGELSMLVELEMGYEKRTILPVPGTINLEIRDMNHDGKKDIVVLASQGNEGIFILYQTGDLQFKPEQIIRMRPEYGSSWFETLDYDRDGDLDIVLVNGDNADYTNFPKPYHGIRLFNNDGNNSFVEEWFYPIYGATKVMAEDFDLDGDFDFAVIAYFNDYSNYSDQSFVYLENQSSKDYLFKPYRLTWPLIEQWLVMDKGDVDQDGDIDLLLGSFAVPSVNEYMNQVDQKKDRKIDLLFLENQQNNR